MEIITKGYSFYTNYGDEVVLENNLDRAFLFSRSHPKTGKMIVLTLDQVLDFMNEGEEFGFIEKRKGDGVWTDFTFFKLLESEPDNTFDGWKNGAPSVAEKTCGYCVSFHDFQFSTDGIRICAKGHEVNHLSACCGEFKKVLMMQCPKFKNTNGWVNIFVCQSRRGCIEGMEKVADKNCVECSSFTGDKRLTKF